MSRRTVAVTSRILRLAFRWCGWSPHAMIEGLTGVTADARFQEHRIDLLEAQPKPTVPVPTPIVVAVIRERRREDLEPLCAVLAEVAWPPGATSDADRVEWLRRLPAERSWVFDAAPVSVAPTRNVRAHLQIAPVAPGEPSWVGSTGPTGEEVLVLTGLVVRPGAGEDGIRRFLLREAIRHYRDRGRTAVLDLTDCPGLSPELAARYGFTPVELADPGRRLMVHGPASKVATEAPDA